MGPRSDHAARAAARIAGAARVRAAAECVGIRSALALHNAGVARTSQEAGRIWDGVTAPGRATLPQVAAACRVTPEAVAEWYAGETPPSKRKPEHAPGSIEAVRMGRTRAVPCAAGEFNWRRLEFGAARRG